MIWYDDILGCSHCWCASWCGCSWLYGCGSCGSKEKKNCDCPNIVGTDCLLVDKTDPASIVLSVQWPTQVVSTDGTVGITTTTDSENCGAKVYDLNVACDDKKVGACSSDSSPGYLYNDKLRVDTSWPLTYTLANCPGNAYVQVWFDESKLQQIVQQDKRVAVNGWCAPRFLDDAVIVWPWLKKEVVWCRLRVGINCGDKTDATNPWSNPSLQTYLAASVTTFQATNTQATYYFSGTPVSQLAGLWWSQVSGNWRLDFKNWAISHSAWITTINKWWRYSISFDGHQEINKGVHGTRVGIIVIFPNNNLRIIQTRYSGLSAPFYSGQTANPAQPSMGHYGNNLSTTVAWWSWPTFSMGRIFARLPVGKHRRMALPSGTLIVPFYRISTVLSWDNDAANTSGQLSIIGEAEGSSGGADGFTYGVDYIDNVCDALSWTDADACSC